MTERHCPNCGVAAARGSFCPSCGSQLPDLSTADDPAAAPNLAASRAGAVAVAVPVVTPSPPGQQAPHTVPPHAAAPAAAPRAWLPYALIGGVIVAVGAIATVILLLVGGDPESDSSKRPATPGGLTAVSLAAQNIYQQSQRQQYYAMLPAGWSSATSPTDLNLQDTATVSSAQDPKIKLTVGESAGGATLQSALAPAGGTSQVILLPGKRTARRAESVIGTDTQVAYAFSGCGRTYVVVGTAPTAKFEQVKSRFGVVASTLQPLC